MRCRREQVFWIFVTAFLFLFVSIYCVGGIFYLPEGFKYFSNYNPKEFRSSFQYWSIVQDGKGIIYIGSQAGLMRYNGVSWSWIDVPNQVVKSMAADKNGRIYIGGRDEIGFVEENKNGQINYYSLLGVIEDQYKNFHNVIKTYWTEKGVYFQTKKFLFRWDGKKMRVWTAKENFYLSFLCNGDLYIRQAKIGLMRLDNEKLVMVQGGEFFIDKSIYMIVPLDSTRMLIGTGDNGFYFYNKTKFGPFPTEADKYLKKNKLYHGIRISTGDIALATSKGGLVIIDSKGRIKGIFNSTVGLQDDNVKYIFEDNWGNIWLGMERAVSKIEYSTPFSFFDNRSGLSGLVLSITKHKDNIYVGSTSGIYNLEKNGILKQYQFFDGQCRYLLSTGNELLAATDEGVFQITNNKAEKIVNGYSYFLLLSAKNSNRIWVGNRNGLISLYRNSDHFMKNWKLEHQFTEIDQEILTLAEDNGGNIWMGTSTKGVLKAIFPHDRDIYAPVVIHYGEKNLLPSGEINVFLASNHIMFATIKKGILRFNEEKNNFSSDFTLGREFADGTRSVFRIVEDSKGDIWFHSRYRNFHAIASQGKPYTIERSTFQRLPDAQINSIFPDLEAGCLWLGGTGGLIRYKIVSKKNNNKVFPTFIDDISVNNKTFSFNSYLLGKRDRKLPVFKSTERNLSFRYSSPFFVDENETQYSYFLEGNDVNWSSWSRESRSVYTNLGSGLMTFHVRARNVYGYLGKEAIFRFKILPPWYKTWWGMSFFSILGGVLFYLGARWRVRKLEKEKQLLEDIVSASTKELKIKNRQLEKQTHQLKEQAKKLEEMAAIKSRFFANISHEFRTPLTLIKGPIEQILEENLYPWQKKQLDIVLRNTQKLLILINQLLDLARLDSGKMQLYASFQNIIPFVKGIISVFEIKAKEKNIKLVFSAQEDSIFLFFDIDKTEQIVGNLLINALKFTHSGGRVEVFVKIRKPIEHTSTNDDMLEISVKDNGIGIPSEHLSHIFERFYRVEKSINSESVMGGTGIGLALIKEMVELHHGKINVHSEENQGSEFVILLPLGNSHLSSEEMIVGSKDFDVKTTTAQMTSLLPFQKNKIGKKRIKRDLNKDKKDIILVVEDNSDMLDFISESLQSFYTVIEATNGEMGLQLAKEDIPDLIISDIMMPKMGGDELCKSLKKITDTSHIPIILLTARASEDSIVHGYECGADDYIVKPFNRRVLLTRIKNLIEIRRQLQLRIQEQRLQIPEDISIAPMDKEFLLELQLTIEKNMGNPMFDVTQLCKKLFMAKTSLNRKIKALTGETPNEFIQSCRLEWADRLLKAKEGNVTEIAFKVGFSSSSYFTRCYKAKFNRLPMASRS